MEFFNESLTHMTLNYPSIHLHPAVMYTAAMPGEMGNTPSNALYLQTFYFHDTVALLLQ